MATEANVKIDEKVKKRITLPPKYKVVFLNDDQTPIDWVVNLLMSIFKYDEISATELTLTIHNEESAVVGVYTYEIAEQKSVEAMNRSRDRGFPLQVKLERE